MNGNTHKVVADFTGLDNLRSHVLHCTTVRVCLVLLQDIRCKCNIMYREVISKMLTHASYLQIGRASCRERV